MRAREIARRLETLRPRYDAQAEAAKLRALAAAAKARVGSAELLLRLHDIVLFHETYPDTRDVHAAARAALRHVAAQARDVARGSKDEEDAALLAGSGLPGTELVEGFSLDAARWLARRYPRQVDLAWDDDSLGNAFDEFLPALVSRVEADGTYKSDITTREWFAHAKGRSKKSDLAWLLGLVDRLACGGVLLDRVFDSLDLELRWRHGNVSGTRTHVRFPPRAPQLHQGDLRRGVPDLACLEKPLASTRTLPPGRAERLLDACRTALYVRGRETDPLTYANPREVMLARLERGIDVAVFGMLPERRLPIDSFFGYVVAKNRVPVGYGGGWVFLDCCQIGVNVFDGFRGGESAELFAAILRVYRQLFRPRLFRVPPYQIGSGNEDAILSGAYWFYDRFGFRPLDEEERRLADRERAKRQKDRRYRSPPSVLRRLAHSRLVRTVGTDEPAESIWTDVEDVGLAVTRWIGRRFAGDRNAAERHASRSLRRILGVPADEPNGETARRIFEQMCVLPAMLPGLERWSHEDKRALAGILSAKGGARERTYTSRMRRHARFATLLKEVARGG